MLPPGHIAAGFLTAKAFLHFAHPELTSQQQNNLLWWGMFFGFAPDLDYFLAFAREKAFKISDFEKNSHRRFLTHAPVLWLIAGLLIYFSAQSAFYKMFGLLVWLGSWSHFLLDSLEYGVMWLWPLSGKYYGLRKVPHVKINEPNFFKFWWKFILLYFKSVSIYLEILIIIVAIVVFTKY